MSATAGSSVRPSTCGVGGAEGGVQAKRQLRMRAEDEALRLRVIITG